MRTATAQIERIAREFWATTHAEFRYNYDIVKVVESSLNVQLIRMPQLSPKNITSWLSDHDMNIPLENNERNLHGALIIQNGAVLMFIDTTENDTRQRYTLAHQVSHFLLDYQMPKERTIMTLGKEIAGVLKGNAEASVEQLVQSAFNGMTDKVYTLFIEKDEAIPSENPADSLALELLAPRYQIIHETAAKSILLSYAPFKRKCRELLIGKYRIPSEIAHKYASDLAGSVMNKSSFLSRLGIF